MKHIKKWMNEFDIKFEAVYELENDYCTFKVNEDIFNKFFKGRLLNA